jgi:Fe2+ or Zn2+ uptake regulation protein
MSIPFDHEAFKAQIRATGTRVLDDDDECPHDEHDHGICLECGKDIMDDLVGAAEMAADAAADR